MISILELFKIGIGPSSSHTVGPMRAAYAFAQSLDKTGLLAELSHIEVTLYGSLAWTGRGHCTDKAIILGLAGQQPDTVDPDDADLMVEAVRSDHYLKLAGIQIIPFIPAQHIIFDGISPTPVHPNTMRFDAHTANALVASARWCSIGGGFVVPEDAVRVPVTTDINVPYPFQSGRALLNIGERHGLSIAQIVMQNECALRPQSVIESHIFEIEAAMMTCIERGLRTKGILPGGLNVTRRANDLFVRLTARQSSNQRLPHEIFDWVSLYAIAVNEENASGGRVVTAPTNGAAGVLPAVLRYYREHVPTASAEGVQTFFLTATAIGALIKMNASISGAEVGCQGEVGAACSMAAAGLAAVLGGTNQQIENAAEIAMEHHLGMTCDPIGGLVQIPCIERNAFGAVKAINAASLALHGTGQHHVSLDRVIATMRETGADMQAKYKETSNGGLAVNLIEC
jgi:L-serine dehydratase